MPERSPDFAIKHWQFYWPEMKQYNSTMYKWFNIVELDGYIQWVDPYRADFVPHRFISEPHTNLENEIIEAYLSYVIETTILKDTDVHSAHDNVSDTADR